MVADLSVTGEATVAGGHLLNAVTPLDPTFPHAFTYSDSVEDALGNAERAQRQLLDAIDTVRIPAPAIAIPSTMPE